MVEMKEWDGFEGRLWKEEINVRQFIQDNYTPYEGDESFSKDLQKLQISFGEHFRNFRKKKEQKAECLTWIQRLYHQSLRMMQDI